MHHKNSPLEENWVRVEKFLNQAHPDNDEVIHSQPERHLSRSNSDVTIIPFPQDSHSTNHPQEHPHSYRTESHVSGNFYIDKEDDTDTEFTPTMTIYPTRTHAVFRIPESRYRIPSAAKPPVRMRTYQRLSLKTNTLAAHGIASVQAISTDSIADNDNDYDTAEEENTSLTTNTTSHSNSAAACGAAHADSCWSWETVYGRGRIVKAAAGARVGDVIDADNDSVDNGDIGLDIDDVDDDCIRVAVLG